MHERNKIEEVANNQSAAEAEVSGNIKLAIADTIPFDRLMIKACPMPVNSETGHAF